MPCLFFAYLNQAKAAMDGFFASPLGYKYFMYASIK